MAEKDGKGTLQIEVFGSCSSPKEEIARVFLSSGPEAVKSLKGEFVICLYRDDEEWVISSPGGIFPYFFTRIGGRVVHGKTVLEVMKRGGYSWSWNWAALGDLLAVDYILGPESLHSRIYRFPPNAILHMRGSESELRYGRTWYESPPRKTGSPRVALEIFNNDVRDNADEKCALSLSGGFDSRAILSALLRFRVRPLLYTMGDEESTDVVIAREVSDLVGLPVEIIRLTPSDYLDMGERIVELTGGAKTARHWHTYIFSRKIALPGNIPFFVGSNGGFARDCFLDYSMLLRFFNLPIRALQSAFWRSKMRPPFSPEELTTGLAPALAAQLDPQSRRKRIREIIEASPKEFLDALQYQFYSLRLRHFIGYGLQMYSDNLSWWSPFLNRDWVAEVWNLPHGWMLGSNWHRYCISSNYPELLKIRETNYLEPPAPQAPVFYRKPWRKKSFARIPYADYPRWFADSEIHEFLREEIRLIDDLIDEKLSLAVLDEHRKKRNRTGALSWMLCMCFLRKAVKEKCDGKKAVPQRGYDIGGLI